MKRVKGIKCMVTEGAKKDEDTTERLACNLQKCQNYQNQRNVEKGSRMKEIRERRQLGQYGNI